MEDKKSFVYIEQFLDALAAVSSYEAKGTATYALCYYAITGEYPDEATDADKMFVGANIKLIEGQEAWVNKSKKMGVTSGAKKQQIGDEELEAAISALYHELGRVPREQEVLRYTNTLATIRKREPWKNRNKICGEETKNVEEGTNFVEKNVGNKKKVFDF